MGCVKLMMYILNIIFLAVGAALLACGIWLVLSPNSGYFLDMGDMVNMDTALWNVAIYIIIAVGGVIVLIAFVGCLGTCTESKCFLMIYSIVVILAILLQLVIIGLIAAFYTSMGLQVGEDMKQQVQLSYMSEDLNSSDTISRSWNRMQIQFECCGSYGSNDYRLNNYVTVILNQAVPWTCCRLEDVDKKYATKADVINFNLCQQQARFPALGTNYLNGKGCYYEMKSKLDLVVPIMLGVISGFVILQILGVIISCVLRKKVDSSVGPVKV